MNELKIASLHTALFAVFYEAKALGLNFEALAYAAKAGLVDGSKPYRGGSANQVMPASDAIDEAVQNVKDSFR